MSNQPERPDWPCGCPNDHRMTATRAWCGACSEWCYPTDGMLCVRGEEAKLVSERDRYLEALEHVEAKVNLSIDDIGFSERTAELLFIVRTALQGGEG